MATTRIVKQVFRGKSTEYYTSITPTTGDILYMAFDGGLSIDEILIRAGSSAYMTMHLDIIYPSSGFVQDLQTSIVFSGGGEWTMNDGSNFAAKWFQVPSGAAVSFNFASATFSDLVEILIVGR